MNRILVAEDDLVSRKFIGSFLKKYGCCDLVVDGLEAMEAFKMAVCEKNYYNLVCLDIMMPKVDGVRTLEIIRSLEKQYKLDESKRAKVIITTALHDFDMIKAATDIGFDAYLEKPIDISVLSDYLDKFGIEML